MIIEITSVYIRLFVSSSILFAIHFLLQKEFISQDILENLNCLLHVLNRQILGSWVRVPGSLSDRDCLYSFFAIDCRLQAGGGCAHGYAFVVVQASYFCFYDALVRNTITDQTTPDNAEVRSGLRVYPAIIQCCYGKTGCFNGRYPFFWLSASTHQ